jgi:8-oxo-dGTP pyrophosphatase MutT (NUDIX family)
MSEQIFQIGIKGLIRNSDGHILMVHIPKWSGNEAHWDLPGGRMDSGENLLDTLRRELIEEIGTPFVGTPKQLMAFVTNITIPVGNERLPLIFIVYEAHIAKDSIIKLDPTSAEDDYKWFSPEQAAKNMEYKFSEEFCQLVARL